MVSNSQSARQVIDVEMCADQNLDTNIKGSVKRKAEEQHSSDKVSTKMLLNIH